MTASVVFHSLYGNRFGVRGLPGSAQLMLDDVAVTPPSPQGYSGNFALAQTANALTALAGGGQTGATPITKTVSRFTTVATAADSALLPAAVAGMRLIIINAAASNSMTVYPATGEAINALSANTGLAIAANKTVEFICAVAGTWNTNLTA